MKQVGLIGNGGHGKVVKEIVNARSDMQLAGIFDDSFSGFAGREGLYTGRPDDIHLLRKLIPDVVFVISVGDNGVRKQLAERLGLRHEDCTSLIHPAAIVSETAAIGSGTVIMAGAVIQADANIGAHCIINTGAIAEHDNSIGDYVHLSPRAALAGGVKVREGAHIGIGASVIPQIEIGRWSVIGAGAAVISPIPDDVTAVGVPARVISSIHT
ncbi:acetyltransferase [Bacillus nakamurai]|uniref:acetyltransferase n=1 Tax=Bacillus nakamurai TaxID=1793963 RepID=UPI0007784172|nr:acetyltransferase [Bacillus nakamurai]KXZ20870.1 acetyltransferase [Bacillus nakamurai]